MFNAVFDPIEITEQHEFALAINEVDLKIAVKSVFKLGPPLSHDDSHKILALILSVDNSYLSWSVNFLD